VVSVLKIDLTTSNNSKRGGRGKEEDWLLVLGYFCGSIEIRRANGNFRNIQTIVAHQGDPFSAIWYLCDLKDGSFITSSLDRTMKRWVPSSSNFEDYLCSKTFIGHTSLVNQIIKLTGQNIIVSAACDHNLILWDIDTAACLRTLRGHSEVIYAVLELSDGTLISGSLDKTIRVWSRGSDYSDLVFDTTEKVMCLEEMRDGSIAIGLGGYGCSNPRVEIRRTWLK